MVDVLTGAVNPSGKTPFTFAAELEDYPAHKLGRIAYPGIAPDSIPAALRYADNSNPKSADLLRKGFFEAQSKAIAQNPEINKRNTAIRPEELTGKGDEREVYAEDILLGYRWFDTHGTNGTYAQKKSRVVFPFGFGLSYTTFEYGKPSIEGRTVRVTVKNTGSVAGKETVQFYVGDDKASVVRPAKELKFFQKIELLPGEEKTVTYTIQDGDLQFFDEDAHVWKAEPGTFTVYVAASSADVRGKVKYKL
ncbi:MAG: fibronectin type III-like domain-contianing protein [Bacteroidales bacterium]|nr:fibronectin type III-like domain-contianing protein [Bacteroidales bacterium]